MLDPRSNRSWFGVLESSQARIPVVFDPQVQPAPNGQVYLYNAERDAIIAYDWTIVSQRLKDVDDTEAAAIKRRVGAKLAAACKEHLASRGQRTSQPRPNPRHQVTTPAEVDGDPWEDVFLEDVVIE